MNSIKNQKIEYFHTEEIAYWIGVFQTDGYFKKQYVKSKKRMRYFISLSVCDKSLTSTLGIVNCDASSILTSDNFLFIEIFSDGNYVETRTININPETPTVGGQYGFDGFFIAFLLLLVIIMPVILNGHLKMLSAEKQS